MYHYLPYDEVLKDPIEAFEKGHLHIIVNGPPYVVECSGNCKPDSIPRGVLFNEPDDSDHVSDTESDDADEDTVDSTPEGNSLTTVPGGEDCPDLDAWVERRAQVPDSMAQCDPKPETERLPTALLAPPSRKEDEQANSEGPVETL